MEISPKATETYEPSSHSGLMKLPPPLTPGIQDFLEAAAATTMNLLGATEPPTLAAAPADNKLWLLLPPHKKVEFNPLSIAPVVAAISHSL